MLYNSKEVEMENRGWIWVSWIGSALQFWLRGYTVNLKWTKRHHLQCGWRNLDFLSWLSLINDLEDQWVVDVEAGRKQELCHTGHASALSLTSCCLLHFSTQSNSKAGGWGWGWGHTWHHEEGGIHGKTCNQSIHFPTVTHSLNRVTVAVTVTVHTPVEVLEWKKKCIIKV